jgi:circadian clock protein KaiB
VAGASALSQQALQRIVEWCEAEMKGCYQLEVVDVYQQPELARVQGVVATPTLVKLASHSVRRIIGNCNHPATLLRELTLAPKAKVAL